MMDNDEVDTRYSEGVLASTLSKEAWARKLEFVKEHNIDTYKELGSDLDRADYPDACALCNKFKGCWECPLGILDKGCVHTGTAYRQIQKAKHNAQLVTAIEGMIKRLGEAELIEQGWREIYPKRYRRYMDTLEVVSRLKEGALASELEKEAWLIHLGIIKEIEVYSLIELEALIPEEKRPLCLKYYDAEVVLTCEACPLNKVNERCGKINSAYDLMADAEDEDFQPSVEKFIKVLDKAIELERSVLNATA